MPPHFTSIAIALAVLVPGIIRFAWLSDTHVGSETGAGDLEAAVADINRLTELDFVVVSGDITEYGSTCDLETAKAILDRLTIPYHIIPGNHDTKWSESGCTAFPRLWGSDRFNFDAGGIRFLGMHQGPRMRMADGHFAPEDVRWLDSALTKISARTPLVFITHYPLDSSISNWYVVADRLKKYDTCLVLVGHGHADRTENYEGIPGIMGRSTLSRGGATGGYNIVTLRNDSVFVDARSPDEDTLRQWVATGFARAGAQEQAGQWLRPMYAVNEKYPGVREKWAYRTLSTIGSSPVLDGKMAIVGDAGGLVYGIDVSSGKEAWRANAGSPVYSSPASARGLVVFGTAAGRIVGFDVLDGAERWSMQAAASVLGSPTICGDTVFIGASDRTFRALDLLS